MTRLRLGLFLLAGSAACQTEVPLQVLSGLLRIDAPDRGAFVAWREEQPVASGFVDEDGRFVLAVPPAMTAVLSVEWTDGETTSPLVGGANVQVCEVVAPIDLGVVELGTVPACVADFFMPEACLFDNAPGCWPLGSQVEDCRARFFRCDDGNPTNPEEPCPGDPSVCEVEPISPECEEVFFCQRLEAEFVQACLGSCGGGGSQAAEPLRPCPVPKPEPRPAAFSEVAMPQRIGCDPASPDGVGTVSVGGS